MKNKFYRDLKILATLDNRKKAYKQSITINGINVHYMSSGKGPDVVMVHGLAANLSFWYMRIVPMLVKDYRVTVYDLRGHGLSGMPRDGYTTKRMTEDLHGLCKETGIKKAHLVGHSLGGAICLNYAILHPEQVRSLSLIDCRIHALQPFRNPHDKEYWMKRREELLAKGISVSDDTPKVVYIMLEELAPMYEAGMSNPKKKLGLLVQNGTWNPNSRAALRWKKLVSTTTFAEDMMKIGDLTRERISQVSHPILLSYGGDSPCLETCRAFEQILVNHKTVIHPGMGHFYPVIAPDLVVQDLQDFLPYLEN